MTLRFFVAGTDTEVGKTAVTAGLLMAANRRGLRTAAIKPVAAGCVQTAEGLRNDDALVLQAAMSEPLTYDQINPVALAAPISPHLAAAEAGRRLTIAQLAGLCRGTLMLRADLTLIEGAGGWRVPISDRELLSDLPRELDLPVILV
ncbi:MAG: dethiobiotin synthase, partial [Spongiibacteraceae bacterium]|nr:dethiobiotin synthase [Spongiibacteraceae bacterium]